MYELIKIENTAIGDASVPAVNARDLYEFLESKQDFSTWIKARLNKARAKENKDFCTAPQIYGTVNGGHSSRLEYFLSLKIAKHVALMENTDRGFEVRDYFIECEKKLLAIDPETKILSKLLKSESNLETTLILKEYKEAIQTPLLEKVAQQQPKVDFYDTVTASEKLIDIGDTSKVLLFKVLRELEILDKDNVPYQKYVSRGYFKLIETVINGKPYIKTAVYQKGLDFLNKTLANAGYERLPR